MEVLQEVKPNYADQLRMAYDKAKKEKNVEAMVYYQFLGPTAASVPFEKFKGSWAYGEWLKKPDVITRIKEIQDEMKRYSWHFKETISESEQCKEKCKDCGRPCTLLPGAHHPEGSPSRYHICKQCNVAGGNIEVGDKVEVTFVGTVVSRSGDDLTIDSGEGIMSAPVDDVKLYNKNGQNPVTENVSGELPKLEWNTNSPFTPMGYKRLSGGEILSKGDLYADNSRPGAKRTHWEPVSDKLVGIKYIPIDFAHRQSGSPDWFFIRKR